MKYWKRILKQFSFLVTRINTNVKIAVDTEYLISTKASEKIKKKATFEDLNAEGELPEDKENKSVRKCQMYEDVEEVADAFIRDLLDISVVSATNIEKSRRLADADDDVSEESSESARTFIEFHGSFTEWPTIANFTVALGSDKIEEYISTWYYEEEWLYDIYLVLKQSDQVSDYYFYETKWCLPTKEYPVAQATASIFFTVEVSRVKPRTCFVEVTYNYEGKRYRHYPFKHSFDEDWLFRIIESKLTFYKTLRF